MCLKQVKITQFRRRLEQTQNQFKWSSLHSGFNAIVGENGIGKTVLLNSLCHHLKGKSDLDLHSIVSSYQNKGIFENIEVQWFNQPIECLLLNGEWMNSALHARTATGDLLSEKIYDNFVQLKDYDDFLSLFDYINPFFDDVGKMLLFGGEAIYDGGMFLKIQQLSSGEKKILYIITSVFLMKCQHKNFILLADCIDYSLSIQWCTKLTQTLMSLCDQIIIATHNPAVIMELPNSDFSNFSDFLS